MGSRPKQELIGINPIDEVQNEWSWKELFEPMNAGYRPQGQSHSTER